MLINQRFRRHVITGWLLAWALTLHLAATTSAQAAQPANLMALGFAGKGTALVVDGRAQSKQVLAIDLTEPTGACTLTAAKGKLALGPGLCQATLRLRLLAHAGDDLSRLTLTIHASAGATVIGKQLAWTQLDNRPGAYTEIPLELPMPMSAPLQLKVSWLQAAMVPGEKPRIVRPIQTPISTKIDSNLHSKGKDDLAAELDELVDATSSAAVETITYPALLVDGLLLENLSPLAAVEAVLPEKVHVYPGEANPVAVTVRNYTEQAAAATVRLQVVAGLDQVIHQEDTAISLAAHEKAAHRFAFTTGKIEFGHEARVSLLLAGQVVHQRSEFFSVGTPIWKTAIQGSGFLTWAEREEQIPGHVQDNRRQYINVEEAFSWQPSSWTDLTPSAATWFTGQCDFHNSLAGLKQWISLSHEQGIKMITYLWPSASGPDGVEFARAHPDWITHENVGLSSEIHDIEDLRLFPITAADARFWDLRSGIWNSLSINRGMLPGVVMGVQEAIASAKEFGWDGARYDAPPGWGAMGAAGVHAEFAQLGISDLMKQLMPEQFAQQDGQWDSAAVSIRNSRYARHLFHQFNPHFALSYNFGVVVDPKQSGKDLSFYRDCGADGGQIMDEEIRGFVNSTWDMYATRIRNQVELARSAGGYHTVVAMEGMDALTRAYAAIFTFAGGSHPYLEYGWSFPSPGTYTQFMTRYGQFCWDLEFAPISPEQAGVSVTAAQGLLWEPYVRQRPLPAGGVQTVLHLINAPPQQPIKTPADAKLPPWRNDLVVTRRGSVEPVVWALSAEPETQAVKLPVRREGEGFTVTVPELRYWTILVWTEGGKP